MNKVKRQIVNDRFLCAHIRSDLIATHLSELDVEDNVSARLSSRSDEASADDLDVYLRVSVISIDA
jgi:hypothetical protein